MAVEAILAERPLDRELVAIVGQAMSEVAAEVPAGLDVEAALASVKARRDSAGPVLTVHSNRKAPPVRTRWRVAIPAIAAAAVVAIGLASWLSRGKDTVQQAAQPAPRFLATGVGVRDSLRLPDGSQVVLGPLSSVAVAAGFGEKAREVEVRGDAWFDVVHDEAKPFTVHAGSATIVDVGTRFAVRSDAFEGVAVSVAEGSVSLRPVNSSLQQGVILKAGDNGLVKSGGQVVTRRGGANPDDLAWLRGSLVFREAPIDEVKASMRRWYGLELRFADSSLASRHITATFNGESPDRVLDVLKLILGADIERRGDTAIVRPAGRSVRSR
ncbi:MAG: FecR domain-containing protein [Gemmatimonadales bacterium]